MRVFMILNEKEGHIVLIKHWDTFTNFRLKALMILFPFIRKK